MSYNPAVEDFRDTEYPMLQGKVYLDHGGTTVYAKSLIEDFSMMMISNLYGNPHSKSDPAHLSGQEVDKVREEALRFFGADPEHFDLIFAANATAAIKIVADSFRDLASTGTPSGTFWYGYHKDAHTSLVGVRELTKGTHHCFKSDDEVEDWLYGNIPKPELLNEPGLLGLFAYPGQSNMTGRRLPLAWTERLRKSVHQDTYSLLDAAALATTTQLDFSNPDSAPDFTAVSFYKIFGFPDLGALIVRKKSGGILSWRKYFGGGTVNMLTVLHDSSAVRKDETIHDSLEDGTLPFHNIIALGCAMKVHKKLYGSMNSISSHTSFLYRRLYGGMVQLTHGNGRPLCTMYTDSTPRSSYRSTKTQGATVAFNLTDANGHAIGHSAVEQAANDQGIYLRSGGLCNPGGIASYVKIEPWHFKRAWSAGFRCGNSDNTEIINGKPTGVVRASLGAMSTISDVDRFLDFLSKYFVEGLENETKVAIEPNPGHLNYRRISLGSKDSGIGSFMDANSDSRPSTQPNEIATRRTREPSTFGEAHNHGDSETKHAIPGYQQREDSRDAAMIRTKMGELRVAAEVGPEAKGNRQPQEHRGKRARLKTSLEFLRGRRSAAVGV